ncbi:igLON family member 5-like [Xyrauchen texanus]|uniref:igLON family member 5-like n=1 Tax=Xyrauchen texanus TaxID=154827 RepID=UPI002242A55E|nr:igLON family member 5-like [Xyrauchen texanus]
MRFHPHKNRSQRTVAARTTTEKEQTVIETRNMSCAMLRHALSAWLLALLWQGPSSAQAAEFGHVPDNITVLEGESVILRCKIDEEVTHKAWLNRTNILFTGTDKWSLDPRVSLVNNNNSEFSIKIESVMVADEGPYMCSFQARNQPRTAHVYLIVHVPARIVNISQDKSVNEGDDVNLFCLAVGRPEPTVNWKDFKYGLMSEGEFLDITEIKRHQAEEFECVTNNNVAPPDTRRVKVTVNYPPIITDVKNMPAQLGKTAILRCEAMAVPTASFEWYRDDRRPIESDTSLKIKNEKTRSLLLFTNVTEKHFGNYTCFASNRLGASNASMLLFRPGAVYGGGVSLHTRLSGVGLWFCLSVSVLMKV